jgi:hypothetical protein
MEEENSVYVHSAILFSFTKKQENPVICKNIDELGCHSAK